MLLKKAANETAELATRIEALDGLSRMLEVEESKYEVGAYQEASYMQSVLASNLQKQEFQHLEAC